MFAPKPWIPIDSYGFLWIPMESYGILWIPMDPYGFLWIPIDSYGFLWIPMGSYGIYWNSMDLSSGIGKIAPKMHPEMGKITSKRHKIMLNFHEI